MGKQSELEIKGIDKRNELTAMREYSIETGNGYSEDHENAKHHEDDKHPLGKGISEGISELYFNTDSNAGGSYDINGKSGVGGRKYLQSKNKYGPSNYYSENSIDTTINVDSYGQYVSK